MKITSRVISGILFALFAAISIGITIGFDDAANILHALRDNTVALAGWIVVLLGLVEATKRHLK